MRRLRVVLVSLGLLAPIALAGQQKVNRAFPVHADASIRITLTDGTLKLTGWDQDSVAIAGQVTGGTFYSGGSGPAAKMHVEAPSGGSATAKLEVQVPRGARVWVKTIGAAVEVEGVNGEVELTSVTGDLTVSGSPRVTTVESMDGTIRLVGARGVSRVRTGGGAIEVRDAGGDLTAGTVGGALAVAAARLDRGRLESVNGTVSFAGNLAPGGALEMESHGGDVRLRFEGPVSADFEVTAVAGAVRDLLTGKGALSSPAAKGKPVRFTLGTGGAQVVVRSFKGTVTLER